MSLYGYKKKHRPALWTQTPEEKRRRELDVLARGLRKVKPTRTPRAKHTAQESRLYAAEARAFVAAAVARGETCPVVAAVPELREGKKYGWPISARLNEVHHTRGRRGPLLRDRRFWLAVSKQGHRWVHANPARARELGFLCPLGQWEVAP